MSKKPNHLTDEENPPLTAEMLKRARPTREVFAELGINYPGPAWPAEGADEGADDDPSRPRCR